jgi:hypothetical protein
MEKQFVERAKDKEFERRLKSIDLEEVDEEEGVKEEVNKGKKGASATAGRVTVNKK